MLNIICQNSFENPTLIYLFQGKITFSGYLGFNSLGQTAKRGSDRYVFAIAILRVQPTSSSRERKSYFPYNIIAGGKSREHVSVKTIRTSWCISHVHVRFQLFRILMRWYKWKGSVLAYLYKQLSNKQFANANKGKEGFNSVRNSS